MLRNFIQIDTQPFSDSGIKILNPISNTQSYFSTCLFNNHILEDNNIFEETNNELEITGNISLILNFLLSFLFFLGKYIEITEQNFKYKNEYLLLFKTINKYYHLCIKKDIFNKILLENLILVHSFKLNFCNPKYFLKYEFNSILELLNFAKNHINFIIVDIFCKQKDDKIKIIAYSYEKFLDI